MVMIIYVFTYVRCKSLSVFFSASVGMLHKLTVGDVLVMIIYVFTFVRFKGLSPFSF